MDELIVHDLEVLKSAAGYYVGSLCTEDGITMPYDRQSGYFRTFEEAEKYLEFLES